MASAKANAKKKSGGKVSAFFKKIGSAVSGFFISIHYFFGCHLSALTHMSCVEVCFDLIHDVSFLSVR